MAKDDYHVIVYQILMYLYNCLKKDMAVEEKYIKHDGKMFNINENYWKYIIINIYESGYIDGIRLTTAWGEKYPIIDDLDNAEITPKGIEYLTDNALVRKAINLLKDTKSIIPFI